MVKNIGLLIAIFSVFDKILLENSHITYLKNDFIMEWVKRLVPFKWHLVMFHDL